MIVQRLCEYYDRIADDPNAKIAHHGFAPQKVSFEVVIDDDGALFAINDIRDTDGKKPTPIMMQLPYEGRTSGVKAMFLWDKAEYLLGYVPKEIREAAPNESEDDRMQREKKISRVTDCFQACKALHIEHASFLDEPMFQSLCKFFASWTPDMLSTAQAQLLDEVGAGFGVFRIKQQQPYIHDMMSIKNFWSSRALVGSEEPVRGLCLITGTDSLLARLHPVIKGVRDAQTSGASIASFNKPAFASFGKSQCYNSPVSQSVAFKYTTALNYLLDGTNRRKLQVGDATCIFWADKSDGCIEDIFGFGLDPSSVEDVQRAAEIGRTLRQAVAGNAVLPDPGVGFHVLGLSPNASRLSIRFWFSGTALDIVGRVAEHQARMEIVKGSQDTDWIPLQMILLQTAREMKEVPPQLGGALLRSVLTGGRYPQSLLAAILRRMRSEQEIRHIKAATIKAILNHNHAKEISPMLDINRPESAYQLGRLFASLERVQEDALPGLNATVKDRYFGAASSTPASVFPRLIRMNQHHIGKLDGGKKIVAEKRIQEILGRISGFPTHLGLVDQGLFAIGYYHQRQDFFTKKDKSDES
jgi:CRISPR-associated protein Csd1